MDKSKAAADAVKLINQAKEDSNLQPLMIKAVCSFFDIMKGKELSLRRIDSSCIILLTKQVSPSIIIRC